MVRISRLFLMGIVIFVGLSVFWLESRWVKSSSAPSFPVEEEIALPAVVDVEQDLVRVPSMQASIVKEIRVAIGQQVKKGELLISLDKTLTQNIVNLRRGALDKAKNTLLATQKDLAHVKLQLKRMESVDPRAISRADIQDKTHEVEMKQVQLAQAQNNLTLTIQALKVAKRALQACDIKAPQAGVVLLLNVHLNEMVNQGQPVLFLRERNRMYARISLEEREIQRYKTDAPMVLDYYGQRIPLKFYRVDNKIVNNERYNRVQEILYYFHRKDDRTVASGQQFTAYLTLKRQ